ncbi:TPA: hydrogenase expression protein [Vibrio cholerae]|nr:hydrogenase expression protein [Vibrio cholerae]
MKQKTISLLVSAILLSPPLLSVPTVSAEVQRSTNVKSESVSSSISMGSVDTWYSQGEILLTNTSDQSLDFNGAEIWLVADKNISIENVWGVSGFSVRRQQEQGNTFIFKHDSTSLPVLSGNSIKLIFGVDAADGNSVDANDLHVEKVIVKNDPAIQGKIEIVAPTSPHSSLSSASVLVEGQSYSETVSVPWGSTFTLDHLSDGEYQLTTLDVSSEFGLANAVSPVMSVTVNSEQSPASSQLQYNAFIYYAGINLILPALDSVAGNPTTDVAIHQAGSEEVLRSVTVPFGSQFDITKLLDGDSYDLFYSPVTVNNSVYQLQPSLGVTVNKDSLMPVSPDVDVSQIATDGFRQVEAQIIDLPSEALPIMINLMARDGTLSYRYEITRNNEILPENIKPGDYLIQIEPVITDETRYVYEGEHVVTIDANTSLFELVLPFKESMSLAVKGFPDFVANGTVTNDGEQATSAIGATSVDAIFKYAGFSGSGDPGVILQKAELPLHRTYQNAQTASQISGKHVLPVMVVYTANASGGASFGDLEDNDTLYKHYATFMTQATAAQEYAAGDGSSPMSFVLNPDFLGELQKNPDHVERLNEQGAVKVNEQLANALQYMKDTYGYTLPIELPTFDNTLTGYIASLNFIMKVMAPDVSFGWQINLWAVGSANWIHSTEDNSQNTGKDVADFVNSLQVYSGNYVPDYIVFDKYERDGFGSEAIANYAYNATSWVRYLSYVKTISDGVDAPAMIWQIPGGHMPTVDESNSMIMEEHEASGGSYFMGDARIGSDISKIRAGLLDKPLSASIYNGASNVGELLEKDAGYDWSNAGIQDLPKNNVFAVFWGGGSTTAVVSIGSNGTDNGWLQSKVDAYAQNPVCLSGRECDGSITGGSGGVTPPPGNKPPVIQLAPSFEVKSGESVTISATASDPDGDTVSYQWTVPADLVVIGDMSSNTVKVTAPITASDITYTIGLDVSDGEITATKATQLIVTGDGSGGGDGGLCADIAPFVQGQYETGEQVTYEGSLYKAERWTDGDKTPTTPYAGWALIGSCNR